MCTSAVVKLTDVHHVYQGEGHQGEEGDGEDSHCVVQGGKGWVWGLRPYQEKQVNSR